MKKQLIAALFGIISMSSVLKAQTPVGTLVQNFNLTDINGNPHSLYEYLDAGKTVVIDISAIWCGPCWTYHGTDALEDFYLAHGPAGADDAMVFFIEGDPSTSASCLYAPGPCSGGSSVGDWVTGATHPIFNLSTAEYSSFPLEISYYPVMYVICPNRTVYKAGTAGSIGTLSLLNSYMGDCTMATSGTNACLNSYTGSTETPCGLSGNAKVILQNMGTDTLTSCTITATVGATTIGPINWTGSLAPYYYQTVTLGTFSVSSPTTMNVSITTPDALASDDVLSPIAVSNNVSPTANISIQMITDAYGSQTTYTLRNGVFALINSGGPYGDMGVAGTTTQPLVNLTLPNDCYTFTVYDSGNDGMNAGYGAGSFTVKYGATTIFSGGTFTGASKQHKFTVASSVGVEENTVVDEVMVFPNPVNHMATLSIDLTESSEIDIIISDNLGQVMAAQKMYNAPAGQNKIDLDFSAFASGIYFINVVAGNKTTVAKIIK